MTHPRGASPVTVLGLGAMGTALAHAFLDAGHRTTVWNRTDRRADDLVARGAVRAKTVAEGLAASPVTVICVLDHAVVRELLDPIPDQLVGRAVVNLTSSTPRQARETADWADRRHLDYLAGSIMVPTPLIGRPEALLLYSGTEEMYQTHQATLANLGGQSEFLGTDAGLASLYELGMVDLFFASMAGFLHAVAMVGSDGVSARRFLPYAEQIVAILPETLNGLAHDVDAKTYPGNEDNLTMNVVGIDHIVQASQEFGVHTGLPEVIRALARRAIASGHGGDGFSRLIEEFRQPA